MEGQMLYIENSKLIASTFIKVEDLEIRIEKLTLKTGQEKISLFSSDKDREISHPIILSEEELLELLHQAIHSGVLPWNFIGILRERIEI
jgi:predicted HAD superfamily hydrolase